MGFLNIMSGGLAGTQRIMSGGVINDTKQKAKSVADNVTVSTELDKALKKNKTLEMVWNAIGDRLGILEKQQAVDNALDKVPPAGTPATSSKPVFTAAGIDFTWVNLSLLAGAVLLVLWLFKRK